MAGANMALDSNFQREKRATHLLSLICSISLPRLTENLNPGKRLQRKNFKKTQEWEAFA